MSGKWDPYKFAGEPTFWALLWVRLWDYAKSDAVPLFESLNDRAGDLGLPITYSGDKSLSWATICQLWVIANEKVPSLTGRQFSQMITGFESVCVPGSFPAEAIKQLIYNNADPAFPDRTYEETLVDTFLVNGAVFKGDPSYPMDLASMSLCLRDHIMSSLGKTVVAPPVKITDLVAYEYETRRPGFFRRIFTNPNKWLFGKLR